MIDFDLVYVEMDGVRPRVRQWDERRQISGKQASRVKLVLQPANSPDTNVTTCVSFDHSRGTFKRMNASSCTILVVRKGFRRGHPDLNHPTST